MADLFSRILSGAVKTFEEVKTEIETVWGRAATAFPALKPLEAAAVSALKQQASNAFAYVDSELAPKFADAVSMAESAGDTLVMSLTHGLAAPALPVINQGISAGFALLHAALDHAEAGAKARFSLPPPNA